VTFLWVNLKAPDIVGEKGKSGEERVSLLPFFFQDGLESFVGEFHRLLKRDERAVAEPQIEVQRVTQEEKEEEEDHGEAEGFLPGEQLTGTLSIRP